MEVFIVMVSYKKLFTAGLMTVMVGSAFAGRQQLPSFTAAVETAFAREKAAQELAAQEEVARKAAAAKKPSLMAYLASKLLKKTAKEKLIINASKALEEAYEALEEIIKLTPAETDDFVKDRLIADLAKKAFPILALKDHNLDPAALDSFFVAANDIINDIISDEEEAFETAWEEVNGLSDADQIDADQIAKLEAEIKATEIVLMKFQVIKYLQKKLTTPVAKQGILARLWSMVPAMPEISDEISDEYLQALKF